MKEKRRKKKNYHSAIGGFGVARRGSVIIVIDEKGEEGVGKERRVVGDEEEEKGVVVGVVKGKRGTKEGVRVKEYMLVGSLHYKAKQLMMLADRDVKDELLDLDFPHWVR
ncbi:hypothetical protein RIF29_39552 [Crotalaria pallida]|uniref:Uncharacterized protein n=1 Tax=Crotalaria pallida TaxID=3830 RepID=A0AAN9HPW1_CROPI